MCSCLAGSDHACCHKALDLVSNSWVFHVFLKCCRVALGLLQNALHDRILQDRHDLSCEISIGKGSRDQVVLYTLTSGSFWILSIVASSVSPSLPAN